jgi:hypothetical protein
MRQDDFDACEDAGELEYYFCECCYNASLVFAKAKIEGDAGDFFEEAFGLENLWSYDRTGYCAKLIEFAT